MPSLVTSAITASGDPFWSEPIAELLAVILAAYVASAETAKGWFYRHLGR